MRANFYFASFCALLSLTQAVITPDQLKDELAKKSPSDVGSKVTITVEYNPLAMAFGVIYKSLVNGYTALAEKSYEVYTEQVVEGLKKMKTTASQKALDTFNSVKDHSENIVKSLKEDISTKKETILAEYNELLDTLNDASEKTKEKLAPTLESLNKIVIKIKDPDFLLNTDAADVQGYLEEVAATMVDCLLEENAELQKEEVSFMDSMKSRLIRGLNLFLKACSRMIRVLAANPNLVTIFSGLVVITALYISYRLGLAFVRVLLWIIKLPFKIVRGVFRYIFGYAQELDFDADEQALREECGESTPAPPAPRKKTATRRLDGFEGLDTENVLEADLIDDDLAEDDDALGAIAEGEEDDEFVDLGKDEPTKESEPKTAPSSAAVASTLAAAVAAVALLL